MTKIRNWISGHIGATYLLTSTFILIVYHALDFFNVKINSFISGILGGLMVATGIAAMSQYLLKERETSNIKKWMGFFAKDVWIIPTYLEHPQPRYTPMAMKYFVVPPFDVKASEIMAKIIYTATNIESRIIGSHRFLREVIGDNLILFCLPEKNQYTRVFLGLYYEIYIQNKKTEDVIRDDNVQDYINDVECKKEYFGLKHEIVSVNGCEFIEWKIKNYGAAPGHEWFRSSINMNPDKNIHEQGRINFDYALIFKGQNPFNPAANVIIISGIHGIGTWGGAVFIKDHRGSLFDSYNSRAQAHLIQIRYTAQRYSHDYVDSDILQIDHLDYMPLPSQLL